MPYTLLQVEIGSSNVKVRSTKRPRVHGKKVNLRLFKIVAVVVVVVIAAIVVVAVVVVMIVVLVFLANGRGRVYGTDLRPLLLLFITLVEIFQKMVTTTIIT